MALAANTAIGVFDRGLAAMLLLLFLPALGVIFILHRRLNRDGGPFLYCGTRIGKDGRLFSMYKIRTLVPDAERQVGNTLYGTLHRNLEIRMGPFLRTTRLDEFPQLINVLRGEMALVGPRPVRPAVRERVHDGIPHYDVRFQVLPGVTGLSQFFTPHGTSKRIRARIDNILVRKMRNPVWRLLIIGWTGIAVLRNVSRELLRIAAGTLAPRPHPELQRGAIRLQEAEAGFATKTGHVLETLSISDTTVSVVSQRPLRPGEQIYFVVSRRYGRRQRQAKCRGIVSGADEAGQACTIAYEPISDLQEYLLGRHVLRATVA